MDARKAGDYRLVVVYGALRDQPNEKQQALIDGRYTCMYRELARLYGDIVYLSPQRTREPFEHTASTVDELIGIGTQEGRRPLYFFIKHDQNRDEKITPYIAAKFPTIYYSCCANNTFNPHCQISVVDTDDRVRNARMRVWTKGKDPEHWHYEPSREKEFDYLLMGRRGDKNECLFLQQLKERVKESRKILWLGGAEYGGNVPDMEHHRLTKAPMTRPTALPAEINSANIGIILTEHRAEGFPQSFLEMTMCGVPVVYPDSAPINRAYIGAHNVRFTKVENAVEAAEKLRSDFNPYLCRQEAEARYSSEVCWRGLVGMV